MSNMFTSAEAFSQNLDKWDTSNVTTMYRMFEEAKTFNGNISSWKTENVTNMEHMFEKARFQSRLIIMKCWECFENEKYV